MPPYQVTPTKIGFHKLFNSQKKKWSQNYLGFMTVVLLGKNHSTMHHFPGLTISSKAPSGNFPVLTGWDWRYAVSRKLTNGLGRLLARWYIISSFHRFQHFHTYHIPTINLMDTWFSPIIDLSSNLHTWSWSGSETAMRLGCVGLQCIENASYLEAMKNRILWLYGCHDENISHKKR